MTQEEANQLILINDSKKSDDIISGINLVFSDISRFQGASEKVLLPFFSGNQQLPNKDNYDVFGIMDRQLYGTLALNPKQDKTFSNVGIGAVK